MSLHLPCKAILFALAIAALAGCASTPAEPVPFKEVPQARIVRPGYTQPATGLVAVDVRRERSRDVIVRFRDALVYVDGEQVTDLMNGEHVVFYLSPGVHRIGVSTQFDPVVEMRFTVTADTRYTNRALVTFGDDHRIALRRVAQ
jgi:curli biogenesis system outer membrane secretion channel CsgG